MASVPDERKKELRALLVEFASHNMEGTADEVRKSDGEKVGDNLLRTIQTLRDGAKDSSAAEKVVEVCWDKLTNGGGWPNVGWREAYVFALMVVGLARISSEDLSQESAKQSMRDLDMALIMGGSNANDIVHALVACIEPVLLPASGTEDGVSGELSMIPDSVPPHAPQIHESFAVERMASISFADFKKKYFKTDTAVVITGAIDEWPARQRWRDLRYLLNNFGHRTVPVELGELENGRKKEGWREEAMLMRDLIQEHLLPSNRRKREVAYLAQHLLFDQIPQLAGDIAIPDYCECGDFAGANAWLGTAGTVTPLHHDAQDNLLAQVVGYKYVRLYDHLQTRYLYVTKAGQGDGISAQGNISPVNPEAPDPVAHPLLSEAKYKEVLLGPGEMLYIPSRHWHYVRSLSPSFSVNFWF